MTPFQKQRIEYESQKS
ncbi:hypothetical protein Bhyg_06693 [Pseudolycoriella hygida]|uniref:Uncharacterized protein n=1 Tax=Pseudolycoriella hygida TaxID=35572 RepID=A0A9Q0N1B8_9DIPT|nr:hypothetical protein Bhyg_06693 [Pseudolycoriella hygida]